MISRLPRRFWRLYIIPLGLVSYEVAINPEKRNSQEVKDETQGFFGSNNDISRKIEYLKLKEKNQEIDWYFGFDPNHEFKASWFAPKRDWMLIAQVFIIIATLLTPCIGGVIAALQFRSQIPESVALPPTPQDPAKNIPIGSLETLWDGNKTEMAELKAQAIFVATTNFAWDSTNLKWHDIILKNMADNSDGGVRYYYIFPDVGDLENTALALQRDLEDELGNEYLASTIMHYISIPEEEFIWDFEHVYYDPFLPNGKAIVVSAISEIISNGSIILDMNIELNGDKAASFRKRFISLWNSKNPPPDWIIHDQ